VFTGGPGTGKSQAAAAVARLYRELGLLSYGNVIEISAADLVGTTYRGTGTLVEETAKRAGGALLMITDAHAWARLPDRGQHILRCLYQQLTRSRDHQKGELAVILAGRPSPLSDLLSASPALAARFPAVIDFPPYDAGQLAAIFATLAGEAGFTLTPAAAARAAAVLAQAERDHGSGSARLAVRLLDEVIAGQACRVAVVSGPRDPAILGTITAADIAAHLPPAGQAARDWPGQYL
jgi:SpoVK/Ycf46/Vps4 family AAA+-type ATPase